MMNNTNKGSLGQYAIHRDPYLEEFSTVPNRKLTYKRWMKDTVYPKRVRKKWVKRYGVKKDRQFLISGFNVFTHPNNVKYLDI